jgi:predicted nucleic-acid-binding protein
MLAVDTNVLVRLIVQDDRLQAARARRLFEREQVGLAKTVPLETERVLRSQYEFDGGAIAAVLRGLAGLANLQVEDQFAVAQALDWLEAGIDFAGGLHLASKGGASSFVTFDKQFVKRTAKLGVTTRLL